MVLRVEHPLRLRKAVNIYCGIDVKPSEINREGGGGGEKWGERKREGGGVGSSASYLFTIPSKCTNLISIGI